MLLSNLKRVEASLFATSIERNRAHDYRVMLYITDLSTKNSENRLPFELKCWATTHFKGFVELSSLLMYLERFGFCKTV